MSMRYRKRLKIANGLHLNFSKNGLSSISVGKAGAVVNILNKRGNKATLGIPGSGFSYTHTEKKKRKRKEIDKIEESYDQMERRWDLEELLELSDSIEFIDSDQKWDRIKTRVFDKKLKEVVFDITNYSYIRAILLLIESISTKEIFLKKATVPDYRDRLINNMITNGGVFGIVSDADLFLSRELVKVREKSGTKTFSINVEQLLENCDNESLIQKKTIRNTVLLCLGCGIVYCLIFAYLPGDSIRYLRYFIVFIFSVIALCCFALFCTKKGAKALSLYNILKDKAKEWKQLRFKEAKKVSKDVDLLYSKVQKGEFEAIKESVVSGLTLDDIPVREDSNISIGKLNDETLLVLFDLPEIETLVPKHKLNKDGSVSKASKGKKAINEEYFEAIVNYINFSINQLFLCFPFAEKIKLVGYTTRETGDENILYVRGNRADFTIKKNFKHDPLKMGYVYDMKSSDKHLKEIDIIDDDFTTIESVELINFVSE